MIILEKWVNDLSIVGRNIFEIFIYDQCREIFEKVYNLMMKSV